MSRKKIFAAVALIFSTILFLIRDAEENRLIKALEMDKQALEKKIRGSVDAEQNIDLHFTKKQQKQIDQLWMEFEVFQHRGTASWFEHRGFIEEEETDSLKAIIKKDGHLGLLSNYRGSVPLQHTLIQIKIGQVRLDSMRIDQHQQLQKQGKTLQVEESLMFEKAAAASLIKEIALNASKEIEVKLIGENAFRSFKLTQKQKNAFKDTWTLHQLMAI